MPAPSALAAATFVFVMSGLATGGGVLPGQDQSPSVALPSGTPPYRSGTAVLRLDASVLDAEGHAVRDLRASDFQVAINGRPRTVLFADFPESLPGRATSTIPTYVANRARGEGRAVAVMVDLESIRPGAERTLLDTAAGLVEKLRPADAVALIPVPGSSVSLTRDHFRIAQAIRSLRGTSNVPNFRHFFTLEEALAYERGDNRTIVAVVERECARDVEVARQSRGLPPVCPTDLIRETRERVSFERQHVEIVLTSLLSVSRVLGTTDAPSTLILISGGLGFDPSALGRFQQVAAELKQAGIAVYAVQLDQREVDASASRPGKASTYSSRDRQSGLANVATMADGAFFDGVGRAAGVFDRLRAEITERYTLGVEAEPGDLDGKPHDVRVRVARAGTVTRSRHLIVAGPVPTDLDARLARAVATPIDAGDLPIAAAAFTVRGEEATSVKVLVRAELGRGAPGTPPLRYASTILGKSGETVKQTAGTAAAPDGTASVLLTSQLEPGTYRLRIAAVDAGGRTGSLEMPLTVGIRSVAGLQLSDVLPGTGAAAPAIYVPAGSPFESGLELSSGEVERFAHTSVQFEVQRAGEQTVALAVNAPLSETAFERQQIAHASIPTEGLAPGEYTLSAVIGVDGTAAGRVSRTFVVDPPLIVEAPPAASARVEPPTAPPAAPESISDPDLRRVLEKVATYVAAYGQNTSAVVGLENYAQYLDEATRPHRLTAEFALVKTGSARWLGYRDVIEVNGEQVPNRRDRLLKILQTSSNPLEEAARLTAENARFNVGPVTRNFNVPTTALLFFDAAGLSRFTFTRKGTKRIDGIEVWEVAFRETSVPTLVTTRAGKSVPAQGTLWVSPQDGVVIRTRLQLSGFADAIAMAGPRRAPGAAPPVTPAPSGASGGTPAQGASQPAAGAASGGGPTSASTGGGSISRDRGNRVDPVEAMAMLESHADIDVTYQLNAQLAMWLPARMTEEYQGPISRLNQPPVQGLSRATATYTSYKSFETAVKIIGPKK
jgi:VWFA-related protein